MKNTLRFDHDARCIVMDRTIYIQTKNLTVSDTRTGAVNMSSQTDVILLTDAICLI